MRSISRVGGRRAMADAPHGTSQVRAEDDRACLALAPGLHPDRQEPVGGVKKSADRAGMNGVERVDKDPSVAEGAGLVAGQD